MTMKEIKRRRVGYLALSTLTLLFLGLIYAFSMFAGPMAEAFGYEQGAIGLTFNIMMIAFCLGGVAGSQFERRFGLRATILASAVLFLVGFAVTGVGGANALGVVYLFYGVLGGAGVGFGYNAIISSTNMWFPDKVGLSSGVLMMGFGLGSLLLGSLAVSLIPVLGLDGIFVAIGFATALVALVCALVLRPAPSDLAKLLGERSSANEDDQGSRASGPALKTPIFYVYWLWALIISAIGLTTIGSCASDAVLAGASPAFATLLVGLVSTCNGCARVLIGILYDKTNVKVAMVVNTCVAVAASALVVIALGATSPVLYAVGALCCGFCYGGAPVVGSAFARQRFGAKNYPLNLSLVNLNIVFASLLNIVVVGIMGSDRSGVFVVMGVLAAVALLDIALFSRLLDRHRASGTATEQQLIAGRG